MFDLTGATVGLAAEGVDALLQARIMAIPDDKLLTTANVAEILGREADTISMHARRRSATSAQIGQQLSAGRWVFKKADVMALAEIVAKGPGRPAYKFVN